MQKPTARQRKLLIEYKKTLSLYQELFEIGIGTLLGDASIQTQDDGKTYRLKFSQSSTLHREYLFHLCEKFDDWVLSPPRLDSRQMCNFQTISHNEFKKLADIFVVDNQGNSCPKRIIPNLVENYLTPRRLAYWMMDDGGISCYNKDYERKGFTINTHCFPKEQVELLCQGLQNRYGLNCWVKSNKKKWVITISGYDNTKVLDLITEYLVPSMYYKIPGLHK